MTSKPKQDQQVNLRLTRELHQEMTEQAKEMGISANLFIVNAIQEKLQRQTSNGSGSIITGIIRDNTSTVISSTVSNSFHETRLAKLEEQMTQVLEALALSPKPSTAVAILATEIISSASDTNSAINSDTNIIPFVPKKPLPKTPISLEELAADFCEPEGLEVLLGTLDNSKQFGIEDDAGNDWDYIPQEDKWIPSQHLTTYLRSLRSEATKTKAKNKKKAAPKAQTAPQATVEETWERWEEIAVAQKKFKEMTGLEPTPANGISIRDGYYLGGTLSFKHEKDWIALVERLAIAANGIPQPIPATLDKADAIYRAGGEYTIPAPPKWAR